jgi:hypothetical protein
MQNFILPDFLDGTKIPKNQNLEAISKICSITSYMKIINDTLIKIDFGDHIPFIDGIPASDFVEIINKDESLLVFLRAYKEYLEKDSKNFIFEKNLVKALVGTNLDVKVKYLPKNFTAFIDLKNLRDQDGDIIQGVFVDIRNKPTSYLCLGFLALKEELKAYTISHLNIPLGDDEDSIEKIIKNHKEIIHSFSEEDFEKLKSGEKVSNLNSIKKVLDEATYHDHIKAIFNALIYVNNTEFKIERNNFSSKKSKKEAQEKIYTKKDFIIFGRDYSLPKEFTCGVVGVSGHFRWQPYGPNRSLLKHIFIKPHTRNYGNNHAGIEQNI